MSKLFARASKQRQERCESLDRFETRRLDDSFPAAPGVTAIFRRAGHLLGAARAQIEAGGAARSIRIHGQDVPVNAHVIQLSSMSAHADANELIAWMRQMPAPPKETFITHGEPSASDALRARIERELGWTTIVPDYRDGVDLG